MLSWARASSWFWQRLDHEMKPRPAATPVQLILGVVLGGMLTIGAGSFVVQKRLFLQSAERVDGQITWLGPKIAGKHGGYWTTVQFVSNGHAYETGWQQSPYEAPLPIGTTVPVLVPPSNPDRAVPEIVGKNYGFSIQMLIGGIALFLTNLGLWGVARASATSQSKT